MTHWLYPANTKYYDVFAAMAEKETWWPMHTRVETGDVVVIYLATPYKQIAYLCTVNATEIDSGEVMPHIRQFFTGNEKPTKAIKPFMSLSPSHTIPIEAQSPFGLSHLKQHGLSGMLMGARNLDNNPELLEYILQEVNHELR